MANLIHSILFHCSACRCLKKYCECRALGRKCSSECTCTGCKNTSADEDKATTPSHESDSKHQETASILVAISVPRRHDDVPSSGQAAGERSDTKEIEICASPHPGSVPSAAQPTTEA
jgi:hypothetical protein